MSLSYALVAALATIIYELLKKYWPDMPVTLNGLQVIVVWLVLQFGVEIVQPFAQRLRSLYK